jgi:hypothetical protein
MGVLPGHAPMIVALRGGAIRVIVADHQNVAMRLHMPRDEVRTGFYRVERRDTRKVLYAVIGNFLNAFNASRRVNTRQQWIEVRAKVDRWNRSSAYSADQENCSHQGRTVR